MPTGLDFALYFNIIFFGVILIGFLIGYFRGMKKTLYLLITTAIFYALFFLTLNLVIDVMWGLDITIILSQVSPFLPELAGASTAEQAVFKLLEANLGDTLGASLTNEVFLDFVAGLSQLVLKLIYTILYFTIGKVFYKILTILFRSMFLSSGKNKKRALKDTEQKAIDAIVFVDGKNNKRAKKKAVKIAKRDAAKSEQKRIRREKKRMLGAILGGAKGALNAFITLIVVGGTLSFVDSALSVIPEDGLGDFVDLGTETEEIITESKTQIASFNSNLYVSTASKIQIKNPSYEGSIPLHLYLFDSVLSFEFNEEQIAIRQELSVLSSAAGAIVNSEYMETNNLSDITAAEVESIFINLGNSNMVTSLIPLGIEVGSEMFDTPVEIPVEELYEIDWEAELKALGAVAAVGFELINTAGMLEEDPDFETITLDGEDVSALFDSLALTELATLGAYVAIEPLLEQAGDEVNAIITVPTDLVWADEFRAFGAVAETVLNTGITVADLQGSDPTVLIGALSGMDFTVLLESQIVSHSLKNIFSGDAGVEGLDIIVVPDNIVWFDVYGLDGETIVTPGELRNILTAVNAITSVAEDFDFTDISFTVIADFDDAAIDAIFDSEILVASISDFLLSMDLGDTPLIIPDSVLDENRYILSSELKTIARSAKVLVSDLACDVGDVDCEVTGFDLSKAFTLEEASINTLTSSDILGATVGQLIIDNAGDVLTIPGSATSTISVDTVLQSVVSKEEINKLFQAVSVLGFTDLENMEFDATIISGLETTTGSKVLDTEKSGKLFGSGIVHATLSAMLFEQTEGPNSPLSVPYFGDDLRVIREYNLDDDFWYLSTDELEDILQAFLTLDITDFENVDTLDLNLIISNVDSLMNSAILHATISDQVFGLGSDIVTVPTQDQDGTPVIINVGVVVDETDTRYIDKDEISSILDALEILGITDINSFNGALTLEQITAEDGNLASMLESATIHATVSDQLIGLEADGFINVPHLKEDNITEVRVMVGPALNQTEYIIKEEIIAMIDALDVLGMTDVASFSGSVNLETLTLGDNKTTVLASSTIQATISKQIIDLDTAGTVNLPYFMEDDITEVRFTVGVVLDGTDTEYVKKSEIEAMIDAMDVLDILDIESFSGSVNLDLLAAGTNAEIVLSSAMVQATVSQQVINLDGTITIPFFNDDETVAIRIAVGDTLESTDTTYVLKAELIAMIKGLDILEITDVETFDGTITLDEFFDETNRNLLLTSSIMQATISEQLIQLGAGVLLVPVQDVDTNVIRNKVGVLLDGTETEYILKSEIGAMFESLEALGMTNINDFNGTIDLNDVYGTANQDIILSSAAMHATISDQLLTGTGGSLIVPDEDGIGTPIRVSVLLTDFLSKAEIKAIIDGLEELQLSDIGSVSFDATTIFNKNYTIIFTSASLQATVSDNILQNANDESEPYGSATLIIPTFFRESINVATIAQDQIEKDELIAIVNSLDSLGIADFGDGMDASIITSMTDGDLDILLGSGSVHTTIDNMLRGNTNIYNPPGTNKIPDLAVEDAAYKLNIVTKQEMKAFIKATNILVGGGSFTTVNFSPAAIMALSPADQAIAVDSMIVRNLLTPGLVLLVSNPLDPTIILATDYENDDIATFLRSAKILELINYYF